MVKQAIGANAERMQGMEAVLCRACLCPVGDAASELSRNGNWIET